MDPVYIYIGLAAVFGLFMAWGIGANDVANAMATSIGSGALTIKQALLVAAVFEYSADQQAVEAFFSHLACACAAVGGIVSRDVNDVSQRVYQTASIAGWGCARAVGFMLHAKEHRSFDVAHVHLESFGHALVHLVASPKERGRQSVRYLERSTEDLRVV